MKRLLVFALVGICCATAAFAQGPGGTVALFSDPVGIDCNIWDMVPGLLSIYVVHIWHSGARAVQFSAPIAPCFVAIYLSDTWIFPVTVGNSQTGVAIGYGGCMPAPTHVLTINYFVQALTGPCCPYPVLPDPSVPSGQIEVLDCASNVIFATGGRAIINPYQCPCNYPVPVEETTWGGIKSLYQ